MKRTAIGGGWCAVTLLLVTSISTSGCESRGSATRAKEGAAGPQTGPLSAPAAVKPYSITVVPQRDVAAGSEATTEVTLEPKGKYKVNLEYPLRLTIVAPAGVGPQRLQLGAKDAAELSARRVVLRPRFGLRTRGDQRFSGELRFSVCTERQCELYTEKVVWAVRAR